MLQQLAKKQMLGQMFEDAKELKKKKEAEKKEKEEKEKADAETKKVDDAAKADAEMKKD